MTDRLQQLLSIAAGLRMPHALPAAKPKPFAFLPASLSTMPPAPAPSGAQAAQGKPGGGMAFGDRVRAAIDGPIRKAASYEVDRICAMPINYPMTPQELENFNAQRLLAGAFRDGFRFFPVQAEGLRVFERTGCGFFPIGVGYGKTLLSLVIAEHAYRTMGIRKIILCVPPQVLVQLMGNGRVKGDVHWARSKVPLTVPIHCLGGRTAVQRSQMATSGKDGLYVLPYSLLQTQDTDDVIEAIAPMGWIADEAHKLARSTAARSKRVERYLKKAPNCFLVCMSGTITAKSVADYYHLIRRSLGDLNPLPNDKSQAMEWAAMIDANAGNPTEGQAGPLTPLCVWASKHFPAEKVDITLPGFRKAYRLRLTTSPGVAASGDADIGVSIIFHNEPVELSGTPGCAELERLADQVENEYVSPNGDEIEWAFHQFKWLNELTAGFYNRLYWPEAAALAFSRGIREPEAFDLLERARTHHAALQQYHRELRLWLSDNACAGLDSPMLVGSDMHRNGDTNVGHSLFDDWRTAKALEFDGMPERESESVLVCPYKLLAAIAWVKTLPKGEGCIIWYYHQAIGTWLRNGLRESGIDALFCPAGANDLIIDAGNFDKVIVASIEAHHEGKNLQHHKNQYVLQWPRPAKTAEQLMGRVHRSGQQAEEVIVFLNRSNLFDEMNFAATLNDAIYIHLTIGSRQKLCYGTHDPLPNVFSPETLRSRGMDPKILSPEERKTLMEKFGDYVK